VGNSLNVRTAQHVVKTFHEGVDAVFCQRPHHAGERCKGVRSSPGFRAVRDFASDHCRAQRPLRPIVGRLHPRVYRVYQEAQQVTPVVMPPQFIEQPLIVHIFQPPVAQLIRHLLLQGLDFGWKIWHRALPVGVPELQRLLQQRLEPRPEVARPAGLGRQHVAERPQDVGQAFLLADVVARLGIPGGFGAGSWAPLEKGAACRFPPRLRCSIAARSASLLAANSATWRCSSATNASRSSRLIGVRRSGAIMAANIALLWGNHKHGR
jgi:hypothetical protein